MPTLMHYAWASQWYDYYTKMLAQAASYDYVMPIAKNIVRILNWVLESIPRSRRFLECYHQVNNNKETARVKFPSRNTILQHWTDLTLDLAMSCLGTRDEDCPIWYASGQIRL